MKLAFISDIHEDIVSLRLAISLLEKHKPDKIICLGDICGFNPLYYRYFEQRNASECVRIIKQNCDVIIAGNHDYHASKTLPEISPDFDFPENWYEMDYFQKQKIANGKLWNYDYSELNPMLSHEDITYLSTLKQFHLLDTEMGKLLMSHYIFPNLSGMETNYCKTTTDYIPHFDFMKTHQAKLTVAGHAHASRLICVSPQKIEKAKFGKKCKLD